MYCYGDGMKKSYTFRLDDKLVKQLKSFDGSLTSNVDSAIRLYCKEPIQQQYDNNTTKTIQVLEDTVMDLRNDKDVLQKRLDFYMLPWYKKVFYQLPPKRM